MVVKSYRFILSVRKPIKYFRSSRPSVRQLFLFYFRFYFNNSIPMLFKHYLNVVNIGHYWGPFKIPRGVLEQMRMTRQLLYQWVLCTRCDMISYDIDIACISWNNYVANEIFPKRPFVKQYVCLTRKLSSEQFANCWCSSRLLLVLRKWFCILYESLSNNQVDNH